MKPRPILWMIVAAATLSCSGTGYAQEREHVTLFESLEAIQDADPERRHSETLIVPTRLLVEPKKDGTHIGFDSTAARTIKISVGHKMVVGCEWTLYCYDGTEPVELRRNMGGSLGTLIGSGYHVVQGIDELAESWGSLQLVAELTVFETDIPMQHMWDPKAGKYRPLWKGIATGVLTGDK